MNSIDIFILIILFLTAISGLRKGFVLSIFSIVGFILSLFIAKLYYPVVSRFLISNTGIFTKISTFVSERVLKLTRGTSSTQSTESILDLFKLPTTLKEGVISNSTGVEQSAQNLISDNLTNIVITIISFFIVFIVAKILLNIAVKILDNITRLPGLNEVNKLLGFVIGVTKGIIIVYIIFAILTPVIAMYPDGFIANNTINSKLGYYFYTNNIIIMYLKTLSL